jgi:hypothetical protein
MAVEMECAVTSWTRYDRDAQRLNLPRRPEGLGWRLVSVVMDGNSPAIGPLRCTGYWERPAEEGYR